MPNVRTLALPCRGRFNYDFPGCTDPTSAPSQSYPGWNINHTRVQVTQRNAASQHQAKTITRMDVLLYPCSVCVCA